jgi:hypothetical protein
VARKVHGRVPPEPFDAQAAAAVADGPERAPVAWLAGCLGDPAPQVHARRHVQLGGPPDALSVEDTARWVDAGREAAGHAKAAGVTVLVAVGAPSEATTRLRGWLDGLPVPEHAEIRGPLGALRRLGDADAAVLVGIALGAGEQGLALVAEGPAADTAAELAVAVEPGLRPRLLTTEDADLTVAVLRTSVDLLARE